MSSRYQSESSWRPPTRSNRTPSPRANYHEPNAFQDSTAALDALPSRASVELRETIRRLAKHSRAPILLEGESGVGKTLFARAVHEMSPRASRPFLACDMATIRGELAPSVLFGHLKGSFTGADRDREGAFASAHHGTLFLDELGKASLEVQALMLTAVELGIVTPVGSDRPLHVDVRCVFATNRPLAECVARDAFLPDLAARVTHFKIRIPPLRERMDDVPTLVSLAVRRAAADLSLERIPAVSDELLELLVRHTWPNNVREVFGAVARIVTEADGAGVLRLSHIPDESSLAKLRGRRLKAKLKPGAAAAAVRAAAGNKSEAARRSHCHRTTIYRRLLRDTSHASTSEVLQSGSQHSVDQNATSARRAVLP